MTEQYEPRIIAFCCNWCSYAAADLAGTSRLQYPPNVRIIKVMCTGRIDPVFVLQAFRHGADGVLVAGCHPRGCFYVTGNEKAAYRMEFLQDIMPMIGLDPKRLRLEWIAGSEPDKFAKICREMVEELRKIGPTPLKGGIF
ncbi:MAG: hydrogenase iron-sulfur subunit [Methanomassiliicoccales archaeon]|nr:hydrogenase iron-sulfur subunit [Methanomassiliicoccales archaeon]